MCCSRDKAPEWQTIVGKEAGQLEAGRCSQTCSTAMHYSVWPLMQLPGWHSERSAADATCKTSRPLPVVLALHEQQVPASKHTVFCMPVGACRYVHRRSA